MTLLLASAARATVGGRSGQEDAFRLWPAEGAVPPKSESGGLLAVLADGMGGHTGGAIAGQTACKTFTEAFSATSAPLEARLKSALNASNEALAKGVEQNAALKGMGCTIVAAWMDDLGIRWTSVGDSLLLLYRLPDVIRLNPIIRWARSWTSRPARTRSRAPRPGETATAMPCAPRSRVPRSI